METLASPAAADAAQIDKGGKAFRPGFHRANPDGSPFRGKHGQFMPRGGRKPKTALAVSKPSTAPVATPESKPAAVAEPAAAAVPEVKPDFSDVARIVGSGPGAVPSGETESARVEVVGGVTHEASVETCLRGAYSLADAVLGGRGEWQPDDQPEHAALKDVTVAWMKANGWPPLPPFLGVVFGFFGYVWKRVQRPKTAARIVSVFPGMADVLGVELPKPVEPAKPQTSQPSRAVAVVPVAPVAPKPERKPDSAPAERFFG